VTWLPGESVGAESRLRSPPGLASEAAEIADFAI
jgi:hypothetical protein